jgi:hypothetical protein
MSTEELLRDLADDVKRQVIETCAKLADDQYDEQPRRMPRIDDDGSYDCGWHDACNHIAKTIRAMALSQKDDK